jgi:hypothetical protein
MSELSPVPDISKLGGNDRSRLLDQDQLIRLRKAVDGSIFDTADGLGFESIKTLVEVASGISPKFFRHFTDSLRQSTDAHSA